MSFESCFGGFAGSKSAPAAMGGDRTLALVRPQAIGRQWCTKSRIVLKNFARQGQAQEFKIRPLLYLDPQAPVRADDLRKHTAIAR